MVKLSIIIPYYETYELTDKLIQVLLPQLTDEVEVILLDDGCNEKRLDKYENSNFFVIHIDKNKGGAFTCNLGIEMSEGTYIGFIDCDDLVSSNYIETLLNTINNHNEDVIFMDWQDMNTKKIIHHPNNYAYWKAIYKRDIIPRFTENTECNFDVPFYYDLNSKVYTKYYIDEILYFYNSYRVGSITWKKREEKRKDMIKCEVLEKFNLKDYDKLENIKRGTSFDKYGELYPTDTFECSKDMADYLTGNNPINRAVVKVIEVEPKKVEQRPLEELAIVEEDSKVICEDKEVEKLFEKKQKKKKGKK